MINERFSQAALDWVGTPFINHSAIKGVGADCVGLIIGVYREVIGDFPLDWPQYVDCRKPRSHQSLNPHVFDMIWSQGEIQRGSVLLFDLNGKGFWHFAIMTDDNEMVHAHSKFGTIQDHLRSSWKPKILKSYKVS